MKQIVKPMLVGIALGGVELAIVGLLAGVGRVAAFEDLAFGFGIATLLFALLVLFGGRRTWAGMGGAGTPMNVNAGTAFAAQVAFEEARTTRKGPPLAGFAVKTIALFAAAAVVLAGFGVSLLF